MGMSENPDSLASSVFHHQDIKDAFTQMCDNLVVTSDVLRDALLQLRDQVDIAHARSLSPSTPQFAEDAVAKTRERENFKQTTRILFDDYFKRFSEGLSEFLGNTLNHHKETVSKVQENASKTLWKHFERNFSSAEHSVANSMHLSGVGENAFHIFNSHIKDSVVGLQTLTSQFPVAGTAVSAFAGAVASIMSFGVGQGANIISEHTKFEMDVMKGSPLAANTLINTLKYSGTNGSSINDLDQIELVLKSNLGYGSNPSQLLKSTFDMRLGEGTTMSEATNTAWAVGLLKEKGFDASSTILKMTYDLRESSEEAASGVVRLAATAAKNSWDIGAYVGRITGLTTQFMHLGYTIADVDRVFTEFSQSTLPNGAKLTYEAASAATEMYLGLRKNLSDAEAMHIASQYGGSLYDDSSFGYLKTGSSLQELSQKGLAGGLLAANLFKKGDVAGSTDEYAKYVSDVVDKQLSNMDQSGFNDEERKNNRYLMVAQKLGLSEQISGLGAQGSAAREVVRKISEREFISDKNIHTSLSSIFKDSLEGTVDLVHTTFPELLGKLDIEMQEIQRMNVGIETTWLNIRDYIGGAFIPILQVATASMSAVGVWLQSGGLLSPTSGQRATNRYNTVIHEFQEFNEKFLPNFFESNEFATQLANSLGVAPESLQREQSSVDKLKTAFDYSMMMNPTTALPFMAYKAMTKPSKMRELSVHRGGRKFQLNSSAAEMFERANQEALQKYGRQIPLASAHRSHEHNKAIGGAPNSNHTRGLAIDIDYNSVGWAKPLLEKHGFKQLGGKFFRHGRWQSEDNHFDFKPQLLARQQVNVYKAGRLIGHGSAVKRAS